MLTEHMILTPVLIPLIGAMIALLMRRTYRLQAGWSLATILVSLMVSIWLLTKVWRSGQPIVSQVGGWTAPFGISLVGDPLSVLFVVMSQFVFATGIVYAMGSKDSVVRYPMFFPLFLILATGLTGTFLTGDLFNMYVFAELIVISGTVLTAVSDDWHGTEAAYKYYYISLIASFFMLIGIGCLYAAYGTLNMAQLAERIAIENNRPLLLAGITFLMATFMVKSAVFPFHFWQPDFHAAAPTAVSAMLSSVVVKLGIYGLLRMTTLLFVGHAPMIRGFLVVLGVIGVAFGSFSAVGTHNAKRMLAYSTLSQIGFILIGIGWGTPLAVAAAIVFTFNHSFIKSAMLMLAGYLASRASIKSASFEVVTGIGKALPLAGILFFIGSLALAGIPPTNGFISKLLLFRSGIGAGQVETVLLVGLASVLTLFYSMRAFQRIWWHNPPADSKVKPGGDRLLAPILLIGMVVVLGLWGDLLVNLARDTGQWLDNPAGYIQAVLRR
jgi:multicomponent Na+:H+ antiporter subunit D